MGFLGNLWKIFERKHICITDRWLPAAAEGLPAGKECSTLGSEPQKWLEWALACAGMFMRIIITSIFLCAVLQQRLKKTSMHALQRSSPPFEWILLSRSAVLKRSPLTPLGVLLEVGGTAVAPPAEADDTTASFTVSGRPVCAKKWTKAALRLKKPILHLRMSSHRDALWVKCWGGWGVPWVISLKQHFKQLYKINTNNNSLVLLLSLKPSSEKLQTFCSFILFGGLLPWQPKPFFGRGGGGAVPHFLVTQSNRK